MSEDPRTIGPLQFGKPSCTIIALIVGDESATEDEAARYVNHLPRTSQLRVYASRPFLARARSLARSKRIAFTSCRTAPQAVVMANVVVVFGDSPFDISAIELLESQGIAVEIEPNKSRRKHRRRGA